MSKMESSELFPVCVRKESKWGYINDKGEIVIEPKFFSPVGDFSEGLAPVYESLPMGGFWSTLPKSKWGYIDKTGNIVIKPAFDLAYFFSEGLAPIVIRKTSANFPWGQEHRVGFINKKGDIVVEPKYLKVGSFSEGMASVTCDAWRLKNGYIDKTGNMVIEPKLIFAGDFSEGLARATGGKHYGFIDRAGNFVIELKPGLGPNLSGESIPEILARLSFSEGLACTDAGCYIDKTGKIVIAVDAKLSWSGKFSEGMACVAIGNKYGYIDKTGKIVIEPRFDKVQNFSEGLAAVNTIQKAAFNFNQWGYIDRKGNMVIESQFSEVFSFRHGLALVSTGTGHGYIDKKGKYVWEPTFPFPYY